MVGEEVVPLANFQAKIVEDIIEVGGLVEGRIWVIEVILNGVPLPTRVPCAKFAAMNWPMELVGPTAIVSPGQGTKDRARHAIQSLSDSIKRRRVYLATGWWKIDGRPVYLHAGGGIGPDGPRSDIEVDLSGDLSKFELPPPCPARQLRAAFERTLELLALTKPSIAYPLLAATYRSVLGQNDSSTHVFGGTGFGKSELAALHQQHFGAAMSRKNLPGSWSSTPNALEGLAFGAKDTLLVIDDFVMSGGQIEVARMVKTADRLFRAQGNNAGRQRMTADGHLRMTLYPRGLILSTGEENVRGQSIRARVLTIEVRKGDVHFERLGRLQGAARDGEFAALMAAFIAYLAPRYEDLHTGLHVRVSELRDRIRVQGHRRTPELVANLMIGIETFLDFLTASSVITRAEREEFIESATAGITTAAIAHEARIGEVNPARQFLEYLASALSAGRAHVANQDGKAPKIHGTALGWKRNGIDVLIPGGELVGWVEGGHLYLESRAAFSVAQRMAREGGEALPESLDTVKRRLNDSGLLASTESRGGATRLEVRRTLDGTRREVLHLRLDSLIESVSQVAQSWNGRDLGGGATEESGPIGPPPPPSGSTGGDAQGDVAGEVMHRRRSSGTLGPPDSTEKAAPERDSSTCRIRGPLIEGEVAQPGPESGPSDGDDFEEGVVP